MSDCDSDEDFEARRLGKLNASVLLFISILSIYVANIRENQATLERLGLSGGNVLGIPEMASAGSSSTHQTVCILAGEQYVTVLSRGSLVLGL